MSIPAREEAATILRSLRPSEKLLNHLAAVAEVAAFLCAAMVRRGVTVNCNLAESAALLHDLDKALPSDAPEPALGHALAGAAWLRANGYPELSDPVARHPVMTLANARDYEEWATESSLETRIVAYADKRALQDLVSLDDRFAHWYRRYPDSPLLNVAHERAHSLEAELCTLAGVAPDQVRRLPWVDAALRAAH